MGFQTAPAGSSSRALSCRNQRPRDWRKRKRKRFAALPSKIESITGYEWGTNVSPENLAQGYTHCFIVSFKDKKGLEAYLPHKDHKAFVEQLLPILDKAFVIDFVAK